MGDIVSTLSVVCSAVGQALSSAWAVVWDMPWYKLLACIGFVFLVKEGIRQAKEAPTRESRDQSR